VSTTSQNSTTCSTQEPVGDISYSAITVTLPSFHQEVESFSAPPWDGVVTALTNRLWQK
jgi:hypothetical protein